MITFGNTEVMRQDSFEKVIYEIIKMNEHYGILTLRSIFMFKWYLVDMLKVSHEFLLDSDSGSSNYLLSEPYKAEKSFPTKCFIK